MYIIKHAKILSGRKPEQDKVSSYVDFSTTELAPEDQFAAFRATYDEVMDVELVNSRNISFPARQTVWDLGKLAFTCTELPGRGYAHRLQHYRKATLDHWYLMLPYYSSRTDRGDRPAAALGLHCLASPFEMTVEYDGVLTLFVPRGIFDCPAALDLMIDSQSDSAMNTLLAEYLLVLSRSLRLIKKSELPRVVEATRSLIALCMVPSREHLMEADGPINSVLMERARRLIARQLADPELTPDLICRELGVSRSRLYRLFEPLGGISTYIRRQRLLRTRDALSDSSDTRQIALIAEQWGFTDASAYSRTFKHEFGMSPKEARDVGWQANGYPVAEARQHPRTGADISLAHLLRSLTA